MRYLMFFAISLLTACGGGGPGDEARLGAAASDAFEMAPEADRRGVQSGSGLDPRSGELRLGTFREPASNDAIVAPYTYFGLSSREIVQMMLNDGDASNDKLASMLLEAGGLGAFTDLPKEEIKRLELKYGIESDESEAAPETARALSMLGLGNPPCVPLVDAVYRNTHRRTGQHSNYIDELGRPGIARGVFRNGQVNSLPRDGCSTTVGSWGVAQPGTPPPMGGYVGGHLIAASLGGSPSRMNLTPQAYEINISTFQRIESAVRTCARNATWMTDYHIIPNYGSSIVTPNSYTVWVRVLHWSHYTTGLLFGGGEGAIVIPNWTGPAGTANSLASINAPVDQFTAAVRAVCP